MAIAMERYFTVCHPFFKVKHTLRCLFSCFSFKPCFVKPLLRDKNEKHICFEATRRGSFALEYKFLIKLILPPCLEPPPPPQTYHLQNSISYFSTHIFVSVFFVYFLLFCAEYRVIKKVCQLSLFSGGLNFTMFLESLYIFFRKRMFEEVWRFMLMTNGCSKRILALFKVLVCLRMNLSV